MKGKIEFEHLGLIGFEKRGSLGGLQLWGGGLSGDPFDNCPYARNIMDCHCVLSSCDLEYIFPRPKPSLNWSEPEPAGADQNCLTGGWVSSEQRNRIPIQSL